MYIHFLLARRISIAFSPFQGSIITLANYDYFDERVLQQLVRTCMRNLYSHIFFYKHHAKTACTTICMALSRTRIPSRGTGRRRSGSLMKRRKRRRRDRKSTRRRWPKHRRRRPRIRRGEQKSNTILSIYIIQTSCSRKRKFFLQLMQQLSNCRLTLTTGQNLKSTIPHSKFSDFHQKRYEMRFVC